VTSGPGRRRPSRCTPPSSVRGHHAGGAGQSPRDAGACVWLFAEAVLAVCGRLVVVLPSQDYRRSKAKPDHAPLFDRLVEAADEVLVLDHATADRQAYEAANAVLLERADRLVAVWNGRPPTGKGGGTADVVLDARRAGLPVEVVWPDGAARVG
jgi:hypothetical protein